VGKADYMRSATILAVATQNEWTYQELELPPRSSRMPPKKPLKLTAASFSTAGQWGRDEAW